MRIFYCLIHFQLEMEREREREEPRRQWRGTNSDLVNVPCGINSDFGCRQEATVFIFGRHKHSSLGFSGAESIKFGRGEWQQLRCQLACAVPPASHSHLRLIK